MQEAYNRPDPPLSEGWKGYVVMAHAIIDPQAAYDEALNLSGYDDGNTKSNTLWWIATRYSISITQEYISLKFKYCYICL